MLSQLLASLFGQWDRVYSEPVICQMSSPLFGTEWKEHGVLIVEKEKGGAKRAFVEHPDGRRTQQSVLCIEARLGREF